MISLIICSRIGKITDTLNDNIEKTIGCPYELIVVKGGTSIFKSYNEGARLATKLYLCFVHEDILFLNQGWGFELTKILQLPKTGLVGIAGSTYKSDIPSSWWVIDPPDFEFDFVKHRITDQDKSMSLDFCLNEVLVIDGVFIACKRDLFKDLSFDESNYSGFHFYDLDLSLQFYFSGYKNFVTNRISIIHNSLGNLNNSWITNAILFHEKWKTRLPYHIHLKQIPNDRLIQLKLLKEWIILISKNGFSYKILLSNFLRFLLKKPSISDLKLVLRVIVHNIFYVRVS
jgi:hypothetical protein